jgi:hypothetical protein
MKVPYLGERLLIVACVGIIATLHVVLVHHVVIVVLLHLLHLVKEVSNFVCGAENSLPVKVNPELVDVIFMTLGKNREKWGRGEH